MNAIERVAAAMLFYFQAGVDAGVAKAEGGVGKVTVRAPTESELETVAEETPRGRWLGVLETAERLVDDAVSNTERRPTDVIRDVVRTVRRGQEIVESFTGKPKDIRDLSAQARAERERGSK